MTPSQKNNPLATVRRARRLMEQYHAPSLERIGAVMGIDPSQLDQLLWRYLGRK